MTGLYLTDDIVRDVKTVRNYLSRWCVIARGDPDPEGQIVVTPNHGLFTARTSVRLTQAIEEAARRLGKLLLQKDMAEDARQLLTVANNSCFQNFSDDREQTDWGFSHKLESAIEGAELLSLTADDDTPADDELSALRSDLFIANKRIAEQHVIIGQSWQDTERLRLQLTQQELATAQKGRSVSAIVSRLNEADRDTIEALRRALLTKSTKREACRGR